MYLLDRKKKKKTQDVPFRPLEGTISSPVKVEILRSGSRTEQSDSLNKNTQPSD